MKEQKEERGRSTPESPQPPHVLGCRLTQHCCHRQDEELQQSVLLLIGEPEKPQLGHCHIKGRERTREHLDKGKGGD